MGCGRSSIRLKDLRRRNCEQTARYDRERDGKEEHGAGCYDEGGEYTHNTTEVQVAVLVPDNAGTTTPITHIYSDPSNRVSRHHHCSFFERPSTKRMYSYRRVCANVLCPHMPVSAGTSPQPATPAKKTFAYAPYGSGNAANFPPSVQAPALTISMERSPWVTRRHPSTSPVRPETFQNVTFDVFAGVRLPT
ncbi:hypothetical protein DPEC_G00244490 [Dallia pectoralis]|uniref:Uncharacterized protein n=1 Tax=Dallia pectoralis TaxID=75939 RepID=A0ACC2FW19_DALPE|nr:hypothetical protein DPEC_G00244490 [Dallia pectoralis]